MPIWDTHTFPSTIMANGYTQHSQGAVNVLWMQGDNPLFDWFHLAGIQDEATFVAEIDRSVERFRMAAVDTRRLLDWAQTRPEIDSRRIAIIGFSMSAMVAANVAGNDPRISTAVFVVGGAHPGEVMSYCKVVVGYMRNHVKDNLGWSQEQFREFFRDKLSQGDPALWQGHYRPEGTLIVESGEDDCIPPGSREALWQATGRPERIVFPYNHWQPFLAMTPVGNKVLTRDIFEFLDRKLLHEPIRRTASREGYIPTVASQSH
jgi:pimeloyl-ACP methyl ester carboxylesterase